MDSNSSQLNENNNFPGNDLKIPKEENSDNFGVLLISHGSSLPYAEETFKEIAKKYINRTGHHTEVGYMKVAQPSISKAIDILSNKKNIKRIVAMPVFLAPGIHTNIDIPIILGLEPKEIDPRCPDGNYHKDHYLNQTDPINFTGKIDLIDCIGPDSTIIDIINKRVESAIKKSNKDISPEKTGVLLVSHGSRLNYNREFITDIYKQYKDQTKFHTGQGFMELCEPTIAQGIDKMLKNDDFNRLIVVPVFLAPGVHTTRDIPTILGVLEENTTKDSHTHNHSHNHNNHSHSHGNDHSHNHDHDDSHTHGDYVDFDGEILYTEPLGADDLIIDIIKDRIENEVNK